MPIRNPFARRVVAEDAAANGQHSAPSGDLPKQPAFERVDTVGSMVSSSSMSGRSRKSQDTGDYQMSVVNDSGVYLPPSPTGRDAFSTGTNGHRRTYMTSLSTLSRSSADLPGRSSMGDIEPFSISRESFDSYRRSFDISAKSPVVGTGEWAVGRQSLDSAVLRANVPGSRSLRQRQQQQRFPPADEGFEDVGLDDGRQAAAAAAANGSSGGASAFIRKHGSFFKFGSDHDANSHVPAGANSSVISSNGGRVTTTATATAPATGASRFLISSRKRAQSGQGAELTVMDRDRNPAPAAEPQEVQS